MSTHHKSFANTSIQLIQNANININQSTSFKNRPLSAATFKGIYSKKPKDEKINIDSFINTHAGLLNIIIQYKSTLINPQSFNDDQSIHDELGRHKYVLNIQNRLEKNNVYHEILKKRPQIAKIEKFKNELKKNNLTDFTQNTLIKEKLFEESVQLNRQLENIRQDQNQLLQSLQRVENEKLKYQKLISEVETFVDQKKGQKISLKELQNLKNEIQYKKNLVIELKRSPYTTQKQEHEIMMKIYQEYAEKYRTKTKQIQQQNKKSSSANSSHKNLDNSFTSNRSTQYSKIVEQESELKILQSQNQELDCLQQITERKVAHTLIQLSQHKEDLKEKEKDIEYLREEIQRMIEKERKNKEIDSKINSFKHKNQNKNEEEMRMRISSRSFINSNLKDICSELFQKKQQRCYYLLKILNDIYEYKYRKNSEQERMKDPSYQLLKEKEFQIQENQKKILQQKQTLQEITNFEIHSKNELNEELNHLKQVLGTLEAKYEQLVSEADEFNNEVPIENFPRLGITVTINNNILQASEGKAQIRVPKVTRLDIKVIAHEIKLRLTLKAIPLIDAVKKLFTQEVNTKAYVNIEEMIQRLQMSPFSIKNYEDALLFARYLIEDNQEEFLYLDLNRTCHYRVIRSIFKNAIGQIQLLDEQQEFIKWKQLSLKITQFQQGLLETSQMYSKNGTLNSEQVSRCLEETLNEIEPEEMKIVILFIKFIIDTIIYDIKEYVLMRMFETTNDYKKLNMELMFNIFDMNNWQARDQRRELYQVYLEEGVQIDDEIDRFPTEINNSMNSSTNEDQTSPHNLTNILPPPSQFKYM